MEEIVATLEALESDSSFCAEHTVPAGALRLTVMGAGPVTLPLKPATVQSLIDVAEPARFGWREKTLLDKRVRNCWEIPAGRLKVADRLACNAQVGYVVIHNRELVLPKMCSPVNDINHPLGNSSN